MAIGLALINQKGSQFKTTTAVNMSYWFAAHKGFASFWLIWTHRPTVPVFWE